MSAESFDDFNSTENMADGSTQPPFQFREDESEKGTLEWLTTEFDNLEQAAFSRLRTYRRYNALYKGIHWRNQDARDFRRDDDFGGKKPRHTVNYIREMVDARTAQMARLGTSVVAIPNNDEPSDVNNAKTAEKVIKARAYQLDLNHKFTELDKVSFTNGHSFMFVYWNDELGDIHPSYDKLNKSETGKQAITKGLKIENTFRIGDVDCKVLGPEVFIERYKTKHQDIDYCFITEWRNEAELKKMYPKKANDFQANTRGYYDYDTTELRKPTNLVQVRYFIHKPTKFFPEGAWIVCCDGAILEWYDFPYKHGKLPLIPLTDVDVYGEYWGRSFIGDIEQMQRMYNNVQSAIARDISIGSAPKWVMPKGACDVSSINNDFSIIEFSGPIAPQLVTKSATPSQNFEIQDRLERKISQTSQVYDISRGEVPTGVTANSALRFLDEQENQRIVVRERKRKTAVIETYKQMLDLMKQFYDPNDGRMLRILGKNNSFMIEDFSKANFDAVYDIQLQNTSALPDSKAGKIAAIIDLNAATQADPIFKSKDVIEMLDLGTYDTFRDRATVSIQAARSIIQKLLDGQPVPLPSPSDDFDTYYSHFDTTLQEISFKTAMPEIRSSVIDYVTALEMLMYDRARVNTAYLNKLLMDEKYPMFFKPEMPLEQVMVMKQSMLSGGGMVQPEQPAQEGAIDTTKVENLPEQNKQE